MREPDPRSRRQAPRLEYPAPPHGESLGDGVFTGPDNQNVDVFWELLIRSQSGDPTRTELLGGPTAYGIILEEQTAGSELEGVTFTGFALGVYVCWDVLHTVRHCRFQECTLGLAAETWYSVSIIEDCLFRNNHGGDQGGPAACTGTSTFTRCVFQDNDTESSGGAVQTYSSDLTCQSCLFINNHADYQGGAIWSEEGGHLDLINCTFYGNVCPDGSAVHSGYHTQTRFHNCIVAFGQGYPVSCRYSQPHLCCSNVYGNVGGDWVGCGLDQQLGTNGNICLDPLFCDPAGGDFGLRPESPCAPFSPHSPECDLMGALPVGCQPSGVPEQQAPFRTAGLLHVRPNPTFGPVSILLPRVPASAGTSVRVAIYDAAGRAVRTLWSGVGSGTEGPSFTGAQASLGADRTIAFDGCNERGDRLPSGVHLVRMNAGEHTLSSNFVLIR